MMKFNIVILFIIILSVHFSFAQKRLVDYSVSAQWPKTKNETLSNDGKYLLYLLDSAMTSNHLVIQTTDDTYKWEFNECAEPIFTNDSKFAIFLEANDTLAFLDMKRNFLEKIPNVGRYVTPTFGNGKWLAYELKTNGNQYVLRNLFNGDNKQLSNIVDIAFSDNGGVLLTGIKSENDTQEKLKLTDLISGTSSIIWSGNNFSDFVFDESEDRLAFLQKDSLNGKEIFELIFYKKGMARGGEILISNNNPNLDTNYVVGNLSPEFSANGLKLFFGLKKRKVAFQIFNNPQTSQADLWSYKDVILKSAQPNFQKYLIDKNYLAVVNEGTQDIIRIENENDQEELKADGGNGQYVLVCEEFGNDDSFWDKNAGPNIYLVSTLSGERILLEKKGNFQTTYFSPKGKFVIGFDFKIKKYFTYNLSNRTKKIIASDIREPLVNRINEFPYKSKKPYGISGWYSNDEYVLINDEFDLWKVDPSGVKPSVCLTTGYGRKTKVILRTVDEAFRQFHTYNTINTTGSSIYLAGFSKINKFNGFFELSLGSSRKINRLTMKPFASYMPSSAIATDFIYPYFMKKSSDSSVYLTTQMTVSNYPNLYLTRDFKNFKQVTYFQPQQRYNWMMAELMKWKLPDHEISEGILYKPENFNSKIKYPVIFEFYQKHSNGLYTFRYPELAMGDLNIAWFVSHGYLVFVPNINTSLSNNGPGVDAVNSIISGAKYLSNFSYVDKYKMGFQGFSFGGYEANYLITQTHLFAAAASSAGICDFVSLYGSMTPAGSTRELPCEKGYGLESTPWQNFNIYKKNSPIFFVNRITTPLLIMHNKLDSNVPWEQGVEYFTALRRAGKRVWMLQYENEGHGLRQYKNQLDYSMRLADFFDYYLKGTSIPKWMITNPQKYIE